MARLAAIVESSDDAIISKTLDGIIVTWNRGAERIFGYMAEEVIGRPVTIIIPPDRRDEEPRILERLRRGERVDHFETVRIRKDGRPLDVSLTISPVRDSTGRIIGASKIARDITEHKRAEDRLHRLVTDLARSNAELENFAYAIAHDLRTPLMSINGHAQVFMRTCSSCTQDNPNCRESAEFIQRAVNHMDRLLRYLLEYARIGQGGLRIAASSCEAALERALTSLRAQIEQAGAVITHDPLPLVMADDALLPKIFENLIENGIKYRNHAPPRIHISSRRSNGQWIISVRDEGIGIPPAYQAQIFKPFHRLYGDEARYEGTGIGLATCKKIVEQHGGRIWVESEAGQGATFFFSLPAPKREEMTTDQGMESPSMHQRV